MKDRKQLKKQPETGQIRMSVENLKICIKNQQGYETLYLNDSLHLQYYNFWNIANLQQFVRPEGKDSGESKDQKTQRHSQGVNTLFLNNNLIEKIQNLNPLARTLVTLNLAHNKIRKIEGLNGLENLVVLDLSFNCIKQIESKEVQGLKKLNRLNIAGNLFTTMESIERVLGLKDSLEFLDLSSNNSFSPEPQVLELVFSKLAHLKVLSLKQSPFVRNTSAYRKRVILALKQLTFLDDRPVTKDDRVLAKAWQVSGLKGENEARKMLRQTRQKQNMKILADMQQRQRIAGDKLSRVFRARGQKQLVELQQLRQFQTTSEFTMLTSQEESLHRLRVQQLERYLQLLRQDCRKLDLDKELGLESKGGQLPKMLIEKRTPQCIYVYNMEESQLEEIRKRYYPEQQLPIKVVNYEKPKEMFWLQEYDRMLEQVYVLCKGDWDMVTPAFNLDVYEFDESARRGLRRFETKDLKDRFQRLQKRKQSYAENPNQNSTDITLTNLQINQLDTLD